jgi:hypothetical protein
MHAPIEDRLRIRAARLLARATEFRDDLVASAHRPGATANSATSAFRNMLAVLNPDRDIPSLASRRLEAYAHTQPDPECPQCWITRGERMVLTETAMREGVDKLACPHCHFTEFVPGSSAAPAGYEQAREARPSEGPGKLSD